MYFTINSPKNITDFSLAGICLRTYSYFKEIREKKGLTQLYIATAVGVTTDTISRWENRRYPSIKTENGEKLAELQLRVTNEEGKDTTPGQAIVVLDS